MSERSNNCGQIVLTCPCRSEFSSIIAQTSVWHASESTQKTHRDTI